MTRTPNVAHTAPTSRPRLVAGVTSPYLEFDQMSNSKPILTDEYGILEFALIGKNNLRRTNIYYYI